MASLLRKRPIQIIKVPAEGRSPTYRQEFRSQPVNYLELIENKDKIKFDHLEKEYDPKTDFPDASLPLVYPNPNPPENYYPAGSDIPEGAHTPPSAPPNIPNVFNVDPKMDFQLPVDSDDDDDVPSSSNKFTNLKPPEPVDKSDSPPSSPTGNTKLSQSLQSLQKSLRDRIQQSQSQSQSQTQYQTQSQSQSQSPSHPEKPKQRSLSKMAMRLKDLLEDDPPPTLSSLHARGEYTLPKQMITAEQMDRKLNAQQQTSTPPQTEAAPPPPPPTPTPNDGPTSSSPDNEDDEKREMLFKFDLIKKNYPQHAKFIPEYTMSSKLSEIKNSYNHLMRMLAVDDSVENYKYYMWIVFHVLEFVITKYSGFDASGFASNQLANMHLYDKLLLELGEKNYTPMDKRWPVEIRLLGTMVMQAVIFLWTKHAGDGIIGMLGNFLKPTTTNTQNEQPTQQKEKKKMKPPTFDLSELPV